APGEVVVRGARPGYDHEPAGCCVVGARNLPPAPPTTPRGLRRPAATSDLPQASRSCGVHSKSTHRHHFTPPAFVATLWYVANEAVRVLAIGAAASWGEQVGNAMNLAADNVQSVVIPGTGHWVAEQMLAALTAFLAPYRS
ncbi:MAG TPA: hypothetical protein VNT27_10055, partial [Propionibacteriaceae bacterium]|nr:hypothetical protein [Propionibacteriaceae bacterium]